MNPYIEIIRPGNAVMAIVTTLLMAIITGTYNISLLLVAVSIFLAVGGGNTINDYFDYKIDMINQPQRPIPSGRISRVNARNYALILFVLASVIGFYIGILPGLIVSLSSLLMIFYAYSLKKIALVGNIAISGLTLLCFAYAGIVISPDAGTPFVLSCYLGFYAFLMTLSREIVKDIQDMEGDREEGARTLPIVAGKRVSSIVAAIVMILDCIVSPIVVFNGLLPGILYLPIMLIAVLIFIYCTISILRNTESENCGKVSKLIKIGMFIAFIAFIAGSI